MSKETILDVDRGTGLIRYHSYDEATDTSTERTFQDVEPILEQNKALFKEEFDKSSNIWPAADIPYNIIYKWKEEFGIDALNPDHWPEVKKLLNSSEWAYLRTGDFKL